MDTMRDTQSIRVTRDLKLTGVMFGEAETLKVAEGQTLNGPLTIDDDGNAHIGLAYDEAITLTAGDYEIVR